MSMMSPGARNTTHAPEINDGTMTLPDRPGWGADINEEVLKAHPWTK